MKKIIVFLSILLVIPIFAALVVVLIGVRDHKEKADIGVVLGTAIFADGSLSSYLKGRLDETVNLYQKGFFPLVVVSGGENEFGLSETKIMKEYLIAQGIPANVVIEDPEGVNTAATAKNMVGIMQKNSAKSAFIVTQFFHVPRTRLAFSCNGISPVYYAPSQQWNVRDLYSLLREVPANMVYWWNCKKNVSI